MRHIFVYGTLCEGMNNAKILSGFTFERKPAKAAGVEFYDIGSFPGITPGDREIKGELLSFTDEEYNKALPWLDRLEGYREGDPHSLYLRKPIAVINQGEIVEAYWFNLPVNNYRIIPQDSYVEYLREKLRKEA